MIAPDQKNPRRKEKQPTIESDTAMENNPLAELISKSVAEAIKAQDQRQEEHFNLLAEQIQQKLNLKPDANPSRSRSISRSRSNSHSRHPSPKNDNYTDAPANRLHLQTLNLQPYLNQHRSFNKLPSNSLPRPSLITVHPSPLNPTCIIGRGWTSHT